MIAIRLQALQDATSRKPLSVEFPSAKVSDYYGINVFDKTKMEQYLSKEAYNEVIKAIEQGTKIDRTMAEQIASGMKVWAMERGATHYTHWFHPLTEGTAEKHDAFIEYTRGMGMFENFAGNNLVQQEPDASSFPSGGLRATFEARGYTAWDPSSPAFVMNQTLIIPTIFISYTGESLDYKTPLLKSLAAIDKAAVDVCHFFDKEVNKVIANLGWEQEYFLVDESLYQSRPDLVLTGRTLIGHPSAKDQQLEDQYFAVTPDRVAAFMRDFEIESYKLGIPCKTRHNEVAPNQYEIASIYEEVNLAVDHNMLIMEIMRRVARKHSFRVLFHEKPFAGINGSGKHSNWSLSTNAGVNIFSPNSSSKLNFQFLTFIVNTLKAVYENADLLRASIVSASNEQRLGGHEAPPNIISVFLGEQLGRMLDNIEKTVSGHNITPEEKTELKLDIGRIPHVLLDNTDRNRTSPFAFTGNRFEFRAVGSNTNCASAMIVLNTIVANQLKQFKIDVDRQIKDGIKTEEAIFNTLKKYITKSKAIRFDGDGYSEEWKNEAEKRGLTNITSCPDALKAWISPKSKALLIENGIFSEKEVEARYEISLEKYAKKIQIESRVLGDMAINHIIPTAIKYKNILIEHCKGLKDLYSDEEYKTMASEGLELIKEISKHATEVKRKVKEMGNERIKASKHENFEKKSQAYAKIIKPYLEEIRDHIDRLELITDNSMWPLAKYRELLFIN
ncbi:MAG: glutamine synthetase III [Bacteroidota bacterium]|nr:glutamine synthetase III [Bacteroidota bacterium]